ncbi:MAG: 16S rRNA (adenine(1518)-N(6)/adenine(1519)-N(6))-dimethyltransferase RsmA [Clostridiales Family XIII bacterium]|jgi:16S rRNA (adenine1518-N6/adenine1519-N6)-dimethyltransferase|nr:16S rRNA (adenine(1518)-N(6)/adenine(1519)-N(6))-dimethyltransferase RsmA [Clostridiales Family XIII bacterium]
MNEPADRGKLYAPSTVRCLKARHGLRIRKSLGQNFLVDKNVLDRIVEGAGVCDADIVLEIGSGLGVLTAAAAEKAFRVVAVETDRQLIPVLEETLAGCPNVRIVHADILKADLRGMLEQNQDENGQKHIKVLGNLPYYITSAIIMRFLEEGLPVKSLTFMMQKEVAERLRAEPGSTNYGAISAAVRYYCEPHLVMNVPREVFVPRPNVDSAVIRLDVREQKPVSPVSEKMFFATIRAGFGQRRKTLLNALTGTAGLSKDAVRLALAQAGVDPVRRAETLGLAEFAAIADAICAAAQGLAGGATSTTG